MTSTIVSSLGSRTLMFLLFCLFGMGHASAQTTFSTQVNTVANYVTVVGVEGSLEPALTAKDFEVRDDGQLRSISLFQAGRLPINIAVLLDDSPSMQASKASTQAAAIAFIRRLTPQDRATVGVFSRTVTITGALTGDADELLGRLRTSSPVMAGTALWDAVNAGLATLEGESGRRVVLVLSDGDDNSSDATAVEMAAQAAREGVMVYAVGIRGGEGRLSSALRDLARDTGGGYFELKAKDDLASTFQRVADELHSQYLLGFTLPTLDGKSHRLEVKVKRSGLTARARKTYVATPPSATTSP